MVFAVWLVSDFVSTPFALKQQLLSLHAPSNGFFPHEVLVVVLSLILCSDGDLLRQLLFPQAGSQDVSAFFRSKTNSIFPFMNLFYEQASSYTF